MPAIKRIETPGNRAHGVPLQTYKRAAVGAGPAFRTEPMSTGTRYVPKTPRWPSYS